MTLAHDVTTRNPAAGSFDTTTGDRTFTHTPSGTPAGVVVLVDVGSTTDPNTGVLYGGVAMALSADATSTNGRVKVYTLIAGIPTGAQTVTIQGCTATNKFYVCFTVTATSGVTAVNQTGFQNSTTSTDPSITLVTTQTAMLFGGMHGSDGTRADYVVGSGYTRSTDAGYGATSAVVQRHTSPVAAGSVAFNMTNAVSAVWGMAAVALAEVVTPSPMAQPQAMFPLFAGSPLQMPFQAPVFDAQQPAAAVTVPNFLQDPPSRTRRVSPPRLRRAGQVTPALPVAPPDMAPGSAPAQRHVWIRRRARLAVPPAPQAVPVDADQLQRPRRRPIPTRSRSAQPVPVQVAAPVNPGFVPAGIVHRAKTALRRGRFTTAPAAQVQPPEFDQSQRRRTALRVRSRAAQLVPPQFNPPIVLQPLAHRIRIGFRRPRPVVLPMAPESSPPVPARRRWQVARVRSRAAQPTPPQFNPPFVPLTFGHRLRVAVRRGRASQPVPVVAAPITPTFVPDALTHRLRVVFRRPRAGQRPTVVPQGVEQPPTLATGPRLLVRPRRGATASPIPAQQAAPTNPLLVSVLLRKVRPALRRGGGRSASPTPAQQAAPVNPLFVFVDIRKVRALLIRRSRTALPALAQDAAPINPGIRRRRVGLLRRSKTATPTPAQPVTPNPPFVFVDVRKVRALLVRRSKTATHIPSQPSSPAAGHTGPPPVVPVRRGRSSQPPIVQTQPPTPPGVRNRQRRRFLVWQRRGKDAWRELGQAVAPVVQFFQGVITGGTRSGPSSYGGTLSGPSATGRLLHGTIDFYGDLYGDGYLGGEGVTDLGVAGTIPAGPQNVGGGRPGPETVGQSTGSSATGGTVTGPGSTGTGKESSATGRIPSSPGITGQQQDGNVVGGSQ